MLVSWYSTSLPSSLIVSILFEPKHSWTKDREVGVKENSDNESWFTADVSGHNLTHHQLTNATCFYQYFVFNLPPPSSSKGMSSNKTLYKIKSIDECCVYMIIGVGCKSHNQMSVHRAQGVLKIGDKVKSATGNRLARVWFWSMDVHLRWVFVFVSLKSTHMVCISMEKCFWYICKEKERQREYRLQPKA